MDNRDIVKFLGELDDAFTQSSFVKLSLGGKRHKDDELNAATAKIIEIKKEKRLSITYTYKSKDIVKNYDLEGSILIIEALLETTFLNANLFTNKNDFQLIINEKRNLAKLIKTKATFKEKIETSHDKAKKKFLDAQNNLYLKELGITGADWQIKKDMSDKFRQINKYIEIFDSILKQSALNDNFTIVDMGSGKGYLTFALYDYLSSVLKLDIEIIGVEYRNELVIECNRIANESGFKKLKFIQGDIQGAKLDKIDVLIALHACDTATDDAIYRGLSAQSEIIIVAPCCHKQVRNEMETTNSLNLILKHGILKERQAEILTDGIRASIMEAYGYKTKVFEFISSEHTPKNAMIVGLKSEKNANKSQAIFKEINEIKSYFGIRYHKLENLCQII